MLGSHRSTSQPTWLCIAACCLVFAVFSGCGEPAKYPSRPITLICPWAKGGGTDRLSRQMALHLEHELGQPVNVINATGGKGVTGHSRGMTAWPDGYTIAMITVELNMLHHTMPVVKMTHEDFQPLALLNQDAAALFVRADAPWRDVAELEAWIKQNPGKLRASGTATGGAWHVALVAWLTASRQGLSSEDVNWISSRGANPSLLQLTQAGIDLVCCSLPEARSQMSGGLIRPLGVMSEARVSDFPDIPTLKEQGTDVAFVGWRGLAVPKDTPKPIVQRLVTAIERITAGQTVLPGKDVTTPTLPDYMRQEKFNLVQSSTPESFAQFLAATDGQLGKLLSRDDFASVSQDRFSPMLFPYILFGLLGLSAMIIVLKKMCQEVNDPIDPYAPSYRGDAGRFVLVVLAVLGFLYAAPVAGFVLTAAAMLYLLLWCFGSTWKVSLPVAALLAPALFHLFAHFLRVPLPHGWLGW